MGIQPKLLNQGEHVIIATRTHLKAMLMPGVWLLVISGLAGFLSTLASGGQKSLMLIVIWVVAAICLIIFSLVPFLKWLTSTYVFTNRRLITRSGVLARRGHDIPVPRISDVAFEKGVLDRILGCGTLIVTDASETGQVKLHDIPQIEKFMLAIQQELAHSSGKADDGA
ncbi:MAG TPA: PH domain-containing protein [Marmoricola sp.]|nr:PH domain-containing protein [Marmoricola sp.]HNI69707.1 PH domain-containing protein [Marmoricola sp.]HNJ78868.1 PH domain-containing protein [Marmoricola sp.]HNN47406.1 PH domain-containing protein [Marmoricola sp.]